MTVHVHRVCAAAHAPTGARFLVDRLWPRGVRKASLHLAGWLKDLAPSSELRRWFGHDPARWAEFRRRYHVELEHHPADVRRLAALAAQGPVILLFAAKDAERNNAVALREYLELVRLPASARRRRP